jgi:hypothetical protein
MKERSIEEAVDASNKAKTDALKEVLPITDNYFRAKVSDCVLKFPPTFY